VPKIYTANARDSLRWPDASASQEQRARCSHGAEARLAPTPCSCSACLRGPASSITALATRRVEAALSRERTVHPTAMPLTCPRAFICRERSGRSPRARGASAPGQPTARGQVQRLVGRRCSNVPTGAVRFGRRRRRTHAPAWPVRPPAALRAASFPRERQRAFRPRGPQALLLRLATGSFSPVRTAADAQLTTVHQRIFKNALACGGCAAARLTTLAEIDVEPARCSLSRSAAVRPTSLV
jgi:hypothetical protein